MGVIGDVASDPTLPHSTDQTCPSCGHHECVLIPFVPLSMVKRVLIDGVDCGFACFSQRDSVLTFGSGRLYRRVVLCPATPAPLLGDVWSSINEIPVPLMPVCSSVYFQDQSKRRETRMTLFYVCTNCSTPFVDSAVLQAEGKRED